ncbi:beta-lactamase-like protein [Aspergillus pseudoustus]|uniref:Beta-lactamase-like protein n=1 Tax=Aspergillus pseudoustus TaxID=1810923 RepID=A0ABR4IWV9_9EURO
MATETANVVTVHALHAGFLTLPERFFINPPTTQQARNTVPSLSFLIQHHAPSGDVTRLIFDLGIRRDPALYNTDIRKHIATRLPLSGDPDVVAALARGNLTPSNVDCVILSHVHWDHVGMPSDFPEAQFIVGNGSLALLCGSSRKASGNGSHSHFETNLLPLDRTVELSSPIPIGPEADELLPEKPLLPSAAAATPSTTRRSWKPRGHFPHTIDLFSDGSVLLVDAPGHLPGHLNLLCRVGRGDPGKEKYVYLAGDACHDRRILTGEKGIAQWSDPQFPGQVCCIHADRDEALETIKKIRVLEQRRSVFGEVEVVLAHDARWAGDAARDGRFFPGSL